MEQYFTDEEILAYLDDLDSDPELVDETAVPDDFIGAEEFYAEGKIVKKDGKFYVMTEDGKKNLGGPYETREEALDRLKQVEHFKKEDEDKKKSKAEEEESVEAGDTYHNRLSPDSKHNKNHRKLPKKCRKCGSTKNIDLHHPSGDRKNLRDTKGIIPLCRSCHRKLHQGKGKSKADLEFIDKILNGKFERQDAIGLNVIADIEGTEMNRAPDFELKAIAHEILDPANIENSFVDTFLAKAKLNKQEDLLYVAFKLVHEGTNGNKDTFLEAELKKAIKSPILKGLNWAHTNENIGVIYDTTFVEGTNDEPAHIVAAAVVWKYKFPHRAAEMLERFTMGKLFFSMETWFDKAQCSTCNGTFGLKEPICAHLEARFGAYSTTHRILHGINFGGAGVVEEPADKLAEGLALANKNKSDTATAVANKTKEGVKNKMDEKAFELLQTQLQEAKTQAKAAEDRVDEAMTDKATAEEELQTAKAKVEDLQTQLETAQAEIQAKQEALEAAAQEIEQLKKDQEELEGFRAKAAEAAENEKATNRVKALKELGFGPSEDDEAYAGHFDRIKGLDDAGFETLVETLKTTASKSDEGNGKPQETKASRIPAGDTDTGSSEEKFAFLQTVLTKSSNVD